MIGIYDESALLKHINPARETYVNETPGSPVDVKLNLPTAAKGR
jgi:hypothetical protein